MLKVKKKEFPKKAIHVALKAKEKPPVIAANPIQIPVLIQNPNEAMIKCLEWLRDNVVSGNESHVKAIDAVLKK